jgi:hypothetical protein
MAKCYRRKPTSSWPDDYPTSGAEGQQHGHAQQGEDRTSGQPQDQGGSISHDPGSPLPTVPAIANECGHSLLFPEVVHTDSDGMKSVDYAKLVPLIVKAIQENQAEIDALKSELSNSVSNVR